MTAIANKVAFITGGASGIGFATAHALAQRGARIVLADIEQSALDRAAQRLRDVGADVLALQLDVTDRIGFAAARDVALAQMGRIELLFNNAGVNASGPIQSLGYQDWDWVLGVNLGGVVNGLVTFLPELLRHGAAAHIVNTASVGGLIGMYQLAPYNASKFAVVGLSESLRADLGGTGVSVSVLCPGVVATNLGRSERNRPAALRGTTPAVGQADVPVEPVGAPDASVMQPETLAERLLDAVEADDFWISTHPEFASLIEQRHRALSASFVGRIDPDQELAMRAMIRPF